MLWLLFSLLSVACPWWLPWEDQEVTWGLGGSEPAPLRGTAGSTPNSATCLASSIGGCDPDLLVGLVCCSGTNTKLLPLVPTGWQDDKLQWWSILEVNVHFGTFSVRHPCLFLTCARLLTMVRDSLKAWGGTVDTAQCSRPEASLARRACGYPSPLGGQQGHCWHTAQNVPAPCSELLGTEPGPPFLLQETGWGQDLALTGIHSLSHGETSARKLLLIFTPQLTWDPWKQWLTEAQRRFRLPISWGYQWAWPQATA